MENNVDVLHFIIEGLIATLAALSLYVLKSVFGVIKDLKEKMKEMNDLQIFHGNRLTAIETSLKYMEFHSFGIRRSEKAQNEET